MNTVIKRSLFWAPRVLCILLAVLLVLLALDVFSEGYGFRDTVLAFVIHLIPAFIVVIMLIIAWRREWAGAILLLLSALFWLALNRGRLQLCVFLGISVFLILPGVLFLLDWIFREKRHAQ